MTRFHRPVVGMLAALSLAVAGCTGATASPGAPGGGGTTAFPKVIASTPTPTPIPTATPTPADPEILFTQAIAAGPAWKGFHLKMALGGTVMATFFWDTTGQMFFAKPKTDHPISVDGTVIEGDFDPPTLGCDVHITLPALEGITGSPTAAEIIYKEPIFYFTLPELKGKYDKVDLGQEAKQDHISYPLPTAGGQSLVGIADVVASLRKHLDANGVVPQVVGVEKIGARNAYRIRLSVPLDKLNTDIAAPLAAAVKWMYVDDNPADHPAAHVKFDSASAELWIYQDTYELAQVQLAGSSSTAGNLTLTMTLTDFGKPVTITAPAASDIAN